MTPLLGALIQSSGVDRSLGFEPRVRLDRPVDAAVPEDIADHLLATLRTLHVIRVAEHGAAASRP